MSNQTNQEELIKQQINSFVNSPEPFTALKRLLENIPTGVMRRLIFNYLTTIVSILSAMGKVVGLELSTVTDDQIEAKSKEATKNAVTITNLYLRILEDPEVRKNIKSLAIALNDSALRPFLLTALITVDQMKPAIDKASEELVGKYTEGLRRLGDGTTDALENVVSGIPGAGNAWSAFSGAMSVLQGIQASLNTSAAIVVSTTYRLLQIMKKINVPGLDAVNSLIELGIKGQNTLNDVTDKVDAANAMIMNQNHTPTPKETTKTFADRMQKESNEAREEYMSKIEESSDIKTPDNAKPNQTNPKEPTTSPPPVPGKAGPVNKKPPTKVQRQRGGSRRRRRAKSNRKTRKR